MKDTFSGSISSFLCTLPINVDLAGLRALLKDSGYRLIRRGRGSRMGLDGSLPCKWSKPVFRKSYFQSFIPIKYAEKQALYIRQYTPGSGNSYGAMVCDKFTMLKLRNYVITNFPGAKMTVRQQA